MGVRQACLQVSVAVELVLQARLQKCLLQFLLPLAKFVSVFSKLLRNLVLLSNDSTNSTKGGCC